MGARPFVFLNGGISAPRLASSQPSGLVGLDDKASRIMEGEAAPGPDEGSRHAYSGSMFVGIDGLPVHLRCEGQVDPRSSWPAVNRGHQHDLARLLQVLRVSPFRARNKPFELATWCFRSLAKHAGDLLKRCKQVGSEVDWTPQRFGCGSRGLPPEQDLQCTSPPRRGQLCERAKEIGAQAILSPLQQRVVITSLKRVRGAQERTCEQVGRSASKRRFEVFPTNGLRYRDDHLGDEAPRSRRCLTTIGDESDGLAACEPRKVGEWSHSRMRRREKQLPSCTADPNRIIQRQGPVLH